MVRKGQFFLAGMLLLGLLLLSLGFTTFQFETGQRGSYEFQSIGNSVSRAVEAFSGYRGAEFMEMMHFFSIKQRQEVSRGGKKLQFTVVAGFQEDQKMKVFTGNFRSSPQEIDIEVNSQGFTENLEGDTISSETVPVAGIYRVNVTGENFQGSFRSYGDSFLLISYRYVSENAVRQDTYTS